MIKKLKEMKEMKNVIIEKYKIKNKIRRKEG